MARELREVWAKRVERWQDSGLTARKFAAELGSGKVIRPLKDDRTFPIPVIP